MAAVDIIRGQQVLFFQSISQTRNILTFSFTQGSGGGTSGRAMAFCLGKLGSNPGSDLGFFTVQNCCQSILTVCQAFSNNVS